MSRDQLTPPEGATENVLKVYELINSKKVVMISFSMCVNCADTKELLSKYIAEDKLEIMEIDSLDDKDEILEEMGKLSGEKTVRSPHFPFGFSY